MGNIRVIDGGPLTTIQDLGRYGFQNKGVPTSGAMDPFSFQLANIALGNPEGTPGLECTLPGLKIEFMEDEYICITGSNLTPVVDGRPCPMWKAIKINKGSILSLSGLEWGCRAYICFSGGLICPPVMSSTSTLLSAGLGGFKGRAIRAGDVLAVDSKLPGYEAEVPGELRVDVDGFHEIRVIMGPGDYLFSPEAIELFLNSEYRIGMKCDRMGCHLEGPPIDNKGGLLHYSQGMPLGGIQVSGEGLPIVLLRDRQTVGGYPLIATVISVDTWLFAHFKPGDRIRFKSITVSNAEGIYRKKIEQFKAFAQIVKKQAVDSKYN